MKYRLIKILTLFFLLSFAAPPQVPAQCPMCRMTAESNYRSGGKAGRGLNTGILYLLALPYLLVGTIGYVWWRNRKNSEEPGSDES